MFVIAFVILLLLAPTAHAYDVVVQDQQEFCHENVELAADQAVALGATTIKLQVGSPKDPCNWEQAMRTAHARGLRFFASLVGNRRQVREVVRAAGPYTQVYSAYNEPNHSHMWGKGSVTSKPRSYVRYYRMVYRTVKRFDPTAKVLFGEYAPDNGRHLRRSLRWMRKVKTDGLAIHPYVLHGNQRKHLRNRVKAFRAVAKRAARRKSLCRVGRGCRPARIFVTEMGSLIGRSPVAFWKEACRLGLSSMAQYMLREQEQAWNTSIFDRTFNPKPAAHRLRRYLARSRCTKRRATAAFRSFNLPQGESRRVPRQTPKAPVSQSDAPPAEDPYVRELRRLPKL